MSNDAIPIAAGASDANAIAATPLDAAGMDATEREVKLQFLEEAGEYLNAIEAGLLQFSEGDRETSLLAALRAAHSVKGGSAMMGFTTLSHTAHRFEDALKALKGKDAEMAVDRDLESLLLATVDGMRQVAEHNRQLGGLEAVPNWYGERVEPLLSLLRDLLGDPTPEDDVNLLSESEGVDMTVLMFETEVEGCLERLRSVVAEADEPLLKQEFAIVAQEFEGLGEMLQLEAFSRLCTSVGEQLQAVAVGQVSEIATAALQAWQRSRSLVLAGQPQLIPNRLELTAPSDPEKTPTEAMSSASIPESPEALVPEAEAVSSVEVPLESLFEKANPLLSEVQSENAPATELDIPTPLAADREDLSNEPAAVPVEPFVEVPVESVVEEPAVEAVAETAIASTKTPVEESELNSLDFPADRPTEIETMAVAPATAAAPKLVREKAIAQPADRERTVRVTADRLERLNDLFGEFAIERNALSLQLRRLQTLFQGVTERMKALEKSRQRLRTAYDRLSVTPNMLPATQVLASMPIAVGDFASSSALLQNRGFDALEMDRYTELHLVSQELMETIVQLEEISADVDLSFQEVNQSNNDMSRTAKLLQGSVTHLRMRPFRDLVGRFPRAVRDLCVEYGKDVDLQIDGSGTLFERVVLEALSDPLMHLVRNAFDHGIEASGDRRQLGKPEHGTIAIKARTRGSRSIVTISDDGRGIDLEKVRDRMRRMGYPDADVDNANRADLLDLIFEPGFSTAEKVTQLSGRGIGMDVVRSNLNQVRGSISVDTELGVGTTFTLEVPLALSSVRVLMAESGGMPVAFPLDAIEEIVLLGSEPTIDTTGQPILNWEGQALPIVPLGNLMHFQRSRPPVEMETAPILNVPAALVLEQGQDAVAIAIDRHWGEQEIVVRPVEGSLALPSGFGGCTVLGDGQVVSLADIPALFQLIRGSASPRRSPSQPAIPTSPITAIPTVGENADGAAPAAESARERNSILVIDDSTNVRRFLALTLSKAGFAPEQAKDGQDALEKLRAGLTVDAVICDIEMPRLDGFGFLAHVRADARFATLPIAMLTSRTGDKHRKLALELGANAYFSKPYQEYELLQKLRDMVAAI